MVFKRSQYEFGDVAGQPWGGAEDNALSIWDDAIAESVLEVTLLEEAPVMHCQGREGADLKEVSDGGVAVLLGPVAFLMVAQGDYAVLGTFGIAKLVHFNATDGHRRYSGTKELGEFLVFGLRDDLEEAKGLEGGVLLHVGGIPGFAV